MENASVFMYLSVIEGLLICCMLGWEIFWLRKMYQVLWSMPTAKQIGEMVDMIKKDRDAIKNSLTGLVDALEPLKNVLNNGVGGMIGSLFGGSKPTVVGDNKEK
jgi:hypothetical protein